MRTLSHTHKLFLLIGRCLALAILMASPSGVLAQPKAKRNETGRARGVLGLFDPAYHNGTKPSKGQGDKNRRLPTLPAGSVVNRDFVVYNDATAGTKLQVRVLPILRTGPKTSRNLPPLLRSVTVPNGGKAALRLPLSVPKVTTNAGLELVLTVSKENRERFRDSILFVAVPRGKGGTTVTYLDRDDKTQGNWVGVYGKQAFLIPVQGGRSTYQIPALFLQRGAGDNADHSANPFKNDKDVQNQMEAFEKGETTNDVRFALRGPGLNERAPVAFTTEGVPLLFRVDSTDGKPHRLSLYLLDYKREGRITEIALFDPQGHRLDTRRVASYGEGAYVRYRFTGSVIVRLVLTKPDSPTLSGVFVDASD
jgi:hypothetical protein